jgi:hypothetical protein
VGAVSVSQFLMLYGWFPLAVLLFFLLLIARFYQRFSGERTFYPLFALPILLFGIATARYAGVNQVAGDTLADLLFAVGGIILMTLCVFLYWLMTRHR